MGHYDLETLALRHQLAVVNRTRRSRVRLTSTDRVLWAWLSRTWRSWWLALHMVRPETVATWRRRGFRLFWTWKIRRGVSLHAPADYGWPDRHFDTNSRLLPTPMAESELNPEIAALRDGSVLRSGGELPDGIAGKLSIGICGHQRLRPVTSVAVRHVASAFAEPDPPRRLSPSSGKAADGSV